jgi:hypothetical protein
MIGYCSLAFNQVLQTTESVSLIQENPESSSMEFQKTKKKGFIIYLFNTDRLDVVSLALNVSMGSILGRV